VRRLAFGRGVRKFVKYRQHYFAFSNADSALGADRWVTAFNMPSRWPGYIDPATTLSQGLLHVPPIGAADPRLRDIEPATPHPERGVRRRVGVAVPELLAGALADPTCTSTR